MLDQPDLEFLHRAYSSSVGDAGTLYNTRRPEQVIFYLEFARKVISDSGDLADVEACKRLANSVKEQAKSTNPARNIILHLLFPHRFERVASDGQKRKIREGFDELSGSAEDVDDALMNIRQNLAKEYGEDFDFYDDNIVWH